MVIQIMFNHNVFGCCQFKKIGRNAKSAFDWIKKNIKRKSVNFFKKACYFGAYGPIMFALRVWVRLVSELVGGEDPYVRTAVFFQFQLNSHFMFGRTHGIMFGRTHGIMFGRTLFEYCSEGHIALCSEGHFTENDKQKLFNKLSHSNFKMV